MTILLWVIVVFACIGLCDTSYLLYCKIKGKDVACIFFPPEWCKKVQYSPQSKTFGVPNALAGFFMYLGILGGTVLFANAVLPWWPVQVLVLIGFAFSLYFTYVQAYVLKAFCTWCVVSACNFLAMAIATVFLALS